ncbi:hypothetical protein OVY01_20230 [Robbsia sp. Bb-Pol-6]|uniref:DUF1440 domain-containing protein n=1 Tax=Robbsia betulipollinis TaxID=2981849 RepID=A0ABT3ZSE0_9BURK|nr:hypothetical protein [Robbsia betulipollinis]MCY0389476.1 hypothetical protein [Robbsia betulipollinis]
MTLTRWFQRAAVSGGLAAVSSAATAAQCARVAGATGCAPLNAVTHCLWPDTAFAQFRPSLRYTATGAAIHAGSGVFWGLLFEALCGDAPSVSQAAGAAAATAAVAYVVDYHVVPERVTPGFEAHLPRRSFAWVYGALGLGLFGAACLRR